MQVAHAIGIGLAADRSRRTAGSLRVPGKNAVAPLRIGAGITPHGVGGGDVFPFVPAWQARVLALAIRLRGKPADLDHGLACLFGRDCIRGRPVVEVARLGEHRGDLVAPPFGVCLGEGEEFRIAHRFAAHAHGGDVDIAQLVLATRQHRLERTGRDFDVVGGVQRHHPGQCQGDAKPDGQAASHRRQCAAPSARGVSARILAT